MTKNWLITEKIIAIFEIILGGVIIYFLYVSISNLINILLNAEHNKWDNISIAYLFNTYHFGFLVGLLNVFAGIFLLFNKRIGWIASLAATSVLVSSILITVISSTSINGFRVYVIVSLIICIVITAFSLLLFKSFREKYGPVKPALITAILINALFIADNLFF